MAIKKLLLLLLIVPLVLSIQSCGKGAGEGYTPPGSGPGDPVYIKLKPARYVAQTNGCIDFYAEVHDAQGELLANIPVTFTNLSEPMGVILDRCGGIEILTPVNTDSWGRAKITIMSTTPGFVTVLAQTRLGSQPRDRKTVLYSFCDTYECLVLAPSIQLDVDQEPPDGIYNEPEDFIIFNPPPDPDDKANLLATVRDEYTNLIPYLAHVVWGADHEEALYLRTETWTNEDGQAAALVEFTPTSLRGAETHVNVWVYSDNVSSFVNPFDIVTFFLQPIVITSVTVTADPPLVEPEGTSNIIALLMLNTGDVAPDGVSVTFTSCLCEDPPDCTICTDPCGYVEPFAQTEGGTGEATAEFTAPMESDVLCRVTATSNGVSGFADVTVRLADILILPPAITVLSDPAGSTAVFTIEGAVPPYIITSSDPSIAFDTAIGDGTWDVAASGDTFTVNILPDACPATITLTAYDSVGTTATATITIAAAPLEVTPATSTICNQAIPSCVAPLTDNVNLTITGGASPFNVISSNNGVITDPGNVPGPPYTFNINAIDGTVPVTTTVSVTLTVTDGCGTTQTATVDVWGNP